MVIRSHQHIDGTLNHCKGKSDEEDYTDTMLRDGWIQGKAKVKCLEETSNEGVTGVAQQDIKDRSSSLANTVLYY